MIAVIGIAGVFFTAASFLALKLYQTKFRQNDRITAYYFTGECHRGIVISVHGTILKFMSEKGNVHTAHVYQCRKER